MRLFIAEGFARILQTVASIGLGDGIVGRF
jgi:hypothetical protein